MLRIIIIVIIGLIAGFCEGASGAGWGVFTLAMLIYIGVKPLPAISTSILVELILGVANNIIHFQVGGFKWNIGVPLLLSGLIGVYIGGRLGLFLPERQFKLFISIVTIILGMVNLTRVL